MERKLPRSPEDSTRRPREKQLLDQLSAATIKDAMKIEFADYDGPTGLFVATGKELLALEDPAGATAFVGAGIQSGTNDPELSMQIQAAIDKAMHRTDTAAASRAL